MITIESQMIVKVIEQVSIRVNVTKQIIVCIIIEFKWVEYKLWEWLNSLGPNIDLIGLKHKCIIINKVIKWKQL